MDYHYNRGMHAFAAPLINLPHPTHIGLRKSCIAGFADGMANNDCALWDAEHALSAQLDTDQRAALHMLRTLLRCANSSEEFCYGSCLLVSASFNSCRCTRGLCQCTTA